MNYGTSIPHKPIGRMYEKMATQEENTEQSKSKKFFLACRNFFWSYVPITKWLPEYRWKEYFISDFMGGITLGCLHVPQALAFSMLAGVHPIMGLSTSCISVYIYCLLGTTVISSYGPVSVTSLLTGNAVNSHTGSNFTNEQLATVITFLIGIYYFGAYILRFWVVVKLLTKAFNSAFILGLNIRIIAKSIKMILGLNVQASNGLFSIVYDVYYTFKVIPSTNLITMGFSIGVITIFLINTFAIQPAMRKKTKVVIPIELLVIIIAITLSYTLQLNKNYDVVTIGFIPPGFPLPQPPEMKAVYLVAVASITVALVNFAITLSVILMFNPDVKPNQELLAISLTNLLTCCLNTIPFGNSMMRTAIANHLGIYTLMASIISSTLVVFVILFMGPLFEPLPTCILGCIIIYGLSTLAIKQIKTIPEVYKSGWENRFIWLITLFSTVFLSIELGLAVGLSLTIRQFLSNPAKIEGEVKKDSLSEGTKEQPIDEQRRSGNV